MRVKSNWKERRALRGSQVSSVSCFCLFFLYATAGQASAQSLWHRVYVPCAPTIVDNQFRKSVRQLTWKTYSVEFLLCNGGPNKSFVPLICGCLLLFFFFLGVCSRVAPRAQLLPLSCDFARAKATTRQQPQLTDLIYSLKCCVGFLVQFDRFKAKLFGLCPKLIAR